MYRYLILLITLFGIALVFATTQGHAKVNDSEPEYVETTFANLSKLYWALGNMDIQNDDQVDMYMQLNECEIYREYSNDELSWLDIRNSARKQILEQKEDFPIHFSITIPVYLTEYDIETQLFGIFSKDQVRDKSMFEINAKQWPSGCPLTPSRATRVGYPPSFIFMLPETISIESIPMTPPMAKAFIRMKMDKSGYVENRNRLYRSRDAYLVLKIKMYSKLDDMEDVSGIERMYILGSLDKIELYANPGLTVLLSSQKMRSRTSETIAEEVFNKRWEKIQADKEEARKKKEEAEAAAKALEEKNKAANGQAQQ